MHPRLAPALTTLLFLGASLLLAACGFAPAVGGTELVFAVETEDPSEPQIARAVEVLEQRLEDSRQRGASVSAAAEKDGTIVLTALLRKALEPEQATELAHSLTSPGKLAFVPVATRDSDPERVLSLPQRGREETLDVVPAFAGEEAFSSADLGRVFPTQDNLGYPALGFEIRKDRREAFGRFTEGLTRQRMAIVLDGVVITAPTIESALYGTSLISGGIHGFTEDELRDLLVALRSGELELDLELLEVRHQNDGN